MRSISLLIEVPEALHDALSEFLVSRPDWDQDRAMETALALFLLQNRSSSDSSNSGRKAARVYLDALFKSREGDV